MLGKCKKVKNDYRKPVSHADSVYALRSNSPPARRVLPYPNDKTRLREGIYYIPNGRLSIIMGKKGASCQKRGGRPNEQSPQEVSAEPMLDGIQPNEQSLSYHLARCVIYMLSAEDVDLTVKENLVGFLLVHNDVLNAVSTIGMERYFFLVEFVTAFVLGDNR